MTKRHVAFADIGKHIIRLNYGWPERDETLTALFNDPPRAQGTPKESTQHTVLLTSILGAILELTKATEAVKRAVDILPEKMEKQRIKEKVRLAKEEAKAAEARERAAMAELDAKFSEPPVMYQCNGRDLDRIADRIRYKF